MYCNFVKRKCIVILYIYLFKKLYVEYLTVLEVIL